MSNKVRAKIETVNGAQYISVNGKPVAGNSYITYLRDNNRYEDFAKAGYKLFSNSLFFGSNMMNENSGNPSFSSGIFDSDVPDYSEFDKDIFDIVAACPDALIFPRVNVMPCEDWERAHPEEMCDEPNPTHPDRYRVCLASDVWADEVKRMLTLFIKHIESMPYANNIVGYQIVGGNTEEWIPYDGNAFIGKRTREKFAEHVRENGIAGTDEEFRKFCSTVVAERIIEFARLVKELTDGRVLVGTFYGYTFELCTKNQVHSALKEVLESEYVDFFCSPISYAHTRALGVDHAYMVPISSMKLHGKLYFTENDTRTHLSKPLNENPAYNLPIWFGHSKEDTFEVLKMHYAKALTKGHASWWFDMWGGWYADPDYMEFMREAKVLTEESVGKSAKSVSEVAIFIDENALTKCDDDEIARAVVYRSRTAIGLMGAPYDIYLSSDFEAVKDNYKAYISLVPVATEASERIKEYSKRESIALCEITEANTDITSGELREFCKNADVTLYSEKDAVVYASESFVFIHTGEDGEQLFTIPTGKPLFDAFTGEPFREHFTAKRGRSYLLKR